MEKIDWVAAEDSINIEATFFCERSQTICIRFRNGGLYTYMGVNHEIYVDLTHAASMGKYLHNVLKAYPYTRWETEHDLISHLNV